MHVAGFPRSSITNPAGIFFRGSGQLSPSLFNQYNSDIDVYITLNENNEATGLGCIITGCIYVTESLSLDNLDIEINTFNWSTPTDNPLWFKEGAPESQFYAVSRPEQEIVLNTMITILPDSGLYAEPSIIIYYPSTAGGSYTGYCYSRVSIFGASIDTIVSTIGYDVYISSTGAVTIFDSYSAYLWCRATLNGVFSWDALLFEVTGYFDRDSVETTLLAEVTQITWDSIVTMANISKQRHVSAMEALDRADAALSNIKAKRNAAQVAYNASVATQAAARANVTSTNSTLNNIRQQLSAIEPQVTQIQSLMNNLCVPIDCPSVCLPSIECVTCTESIESLTYSECDSTCYEDVARPIDPGTKMVDCWELEELTLNQLEAFCGWRSDDYIDYGCRSRRYNLTLLSSQPLRCSRPALDYPYAADTHSYDCQMACESLPQIVDILYTCCSTASCGMELNPAECLLYNQACRTYRNVGLTNGTHGMSQEVATLLTMEATAEQSYNAAVYSEMVATQMVDMAEEMLNTLELKYNNSLTAAVNAQNQLNNVTNQVTNDLVVYDYLQSIPDNTNLEIENISFVSYQNVSNPNSILILSVEYKIGEESDPTYIEDTAYGTFDFSRSDVRDLLVYDLRSTIVRSIASRDQILTSKRDIKVVRQRRQQVIDPGSNSVLSQFRENCITLQNAEETLEDLIASLGRLSSLYYSSYNSLQNLTNELVMLQSNYAASGIGRTMFVNNTMYMNDSSYNVNLDAAQQLGIDVMAISSQISDSMEMVQAREVINGQLNLTRTRMQNLGYDMFEDWSQQIRSMLLGAQTDACYSFHDCSSLLINEIRDILASTPTDSLGPVRDTFEQTAQEFLEVTSSSNLTIVQAYNRSISLGHVIARLRNVNYWCVIPPNITEQPRPYGDFFVGQFYFISCNATGTPAPTYSWWKDGEVIPGAINSTLFFNALSRDDEGTYTCVATNLVHSVRSMPAIIKVDTLPEIIAQPEDADVYVCSSNGAIFQVNATGIPAPQYQWYFRHIHSTVFEPIPDATSSVLFIAQPRAENEGTYYCYVNNSRGSVSSEHVQLHLLDFEVTRLSVIATFNIYQCSRSSANHVFLYNSIGSQPVDYSTAFYEVVVEALNNLTDIDLLDPLNYYKESDVSENGSRIEIDIVTPRPAISDSDCADIITIAEYLTTVSRELNMTLTMFRDEIASEILFRINNLTYCINPPVIRPDAPLCPATGGAQFGGVLCRKLFVYSKHMPCGLCFYLKCTAKCPPGTYQTEDSDTGIQKCQECPKGTYQTEIGQTQCTPCPQNRTTEFNGTRSDSRCFRKIINHVNKLKFILYCFSTL